MNLGVWPVCIYGGAGWTVYSPSPGDQKVFTSTWLLSGKDPCKEPGASKAFKQDKTSL